MNPVLMLARNCKHMTLDALASVMRQDVPVEVLLIDQDSTDGLREAVRCQFPEVSTVTFRPQKSVAGAWNYGLRWWFEQCGAEHVLTVNNDTVLRSDCYRTLRDDGGLFVTAVGVDTLAALDVEPSLAKRDHPDFSCWLMRREAWERGVKFDEKFEGAYGEDADLHLQMHQKGIHAYCIDIPYFHYASGTLKSCHPDERKRICDQADTNREYFKAKHGCGIGSPEYYARFVTVPAATQSLH